MNILINDNIVKLPDFIIVGAAKSGSTSIYKYLKQHPQIFMPDLKEPRFFAFCDNAFPPGEFAKKALPDTVTSFEEYVKLFEPAEEGQILGEASVHYLYLYEETIKNIKRHIPNWKDLKIIVNLRDPSEAAFSFYSFNVQGGLETLEFEDALDKDQELTSNIKNNFDRLQLLFDHRRFGDYVWFFNYYRQVKEYMEDFPNVRVYLNDDLKSDAQGVIKDMFRFLGVDDSFTPDVSEKHYVSMIPRIGFLRNVYRSLSKINHKFSDNYFMNSLIPYEKRRQLGRKIMVSRLTSRRLTIKEHTRQHLRELYREDVLRLQELIGRDLSSWL
jgi:hypothetical protein